jgi:hypothetical protein
METKDIFGPEVIMAVSVKIMVRLVVRSYSSGRDQRNIAPPFSREKCKPCKKLRDVERQAQLISAL